MGLSFLVPAFLAGALALAIPIWVHLRNRPKTEKIDFPSLMFLEQIPYRSVQKQQLRHRLLFAARALALLLLALAFARPFLGSVGVVSDSPAGAREVVVVVDQSWSMGYGDRWSQAVRAAQDAVGGLVPGDRASLVLFSSEPRVAAESAADPGVLLAALAAARPGDGTTSLAAGLRAARRILAESALARRQVVLISDFQRSGWQVDASVEMPEGTVVEPVDVGGAADNTSIADVSLRRDTSDPDADQLLVSARVTNQGAPVARTIAAQLEIAGTVVQSRGVEVPANGAAQVTFEPVIVDTGGVRGTVRVGTDALAADNEFHFVVPTGQRIGAMILDNPAGGASDSLYVEQALRIGVHPGFDVERTRLGDLGPRDLEGFRVVVLNDTGEPDSGTVATLQGFMQDGGGVFVALGEMWQPTSGAGGLVPFGVGDSIDRTVELGATLTFLDTSHPALELFAAPGSGDFTVTRHYRYRALEPRPATGVFGRFDDGRAALLEVSVGEGRLIVWTSTLDTFWNDFALQPVFLPFMQEIAKYAAGYRAPRPWLDAGIALADRDVVAAAGGVAPSRGVDLSVTTDTASGGPDGDPGLRLSPGFHAVRWSGGEDAGAGVVAVNLDRAEADLASLDPEEVAAAVVWRGGGAVEQQQEVEPTPEEVERGQSVWWYLLIAAFILLAAETALSNRVSSRAS